MNILTNFISEEERCHRFYDKTGDAQLRIHKVFPGVEIIYNSVHMDRCDLASEETGNLIEIHHCREGRMEHQYGNSLVYLMPGDLSISRRRDVEDICRFPLRHYHGITIVINEDTAPKCFSCLLKDVNVQPGKVADKLCGEDGCFVIRKQEYVEHIFSELYTVPESHKKGYFKIKILELLFVLSWLDPARETAPDTIVTPVQAALASKAAEYLSNQKDRKVTVEELAEQMHVSVTGLRNAFKAVYGVPVSAYGRILKMQAASLELIHTDLSIAEIAGNAGYDNPSKFSAAFKEIMGESPLDYRKEHTQK